MHTTLSPTTGLTTLRSSRNRCSRCNGHMVHDICIDLDSDCGYSTCQVLRCIQCGDMVDEVILRNRSLCIPEAMSAAAA